MKNLVAVIFGIFFPVFSMAQAVSFTAVNVGLTLPEVALLDIEPNNSAVSLVLNSPTEAGSFVKNTLVSSAKWINYTSAVSLGKTRNVLVHIEYGSTPSGTVLKAMCSASSGGKGALGTSTGNITISNVPQKIIAGIGPAATGNGANFGHSISYILEVTDVGKLNFNTSGTLGLIFTLIDN